MTHHHVHARPSAARRLCRPDAELSAAASPIDVEQAAAAHGRSSSNESDAKKAGAATPTGNDRSSSSGSSFFQRLGTGMKDISGRTWRVATYGLQYDIHKVRYCCLAAAALPLPIAAAAAAVAPAIPAIPAPASAAGTTLLLPQPVVLLPAQMPQRPPCAAAGLFRHVLSMSARPAPTWPQVVDEDPIVAKIHAHAEVFDPRAEYAFAYLQVCVCVGGGARGIACYCRVLRAWLHAGTRACIPR